MKTVTFYRIHKWDGGDREYPSNEGFTTQKAADNYIDRLEQNNQGHYASIHKESIALYSTADEYERDGNGKAEKREKEAALAKLTNRDKMLLGLD